MHPGIHCVLEIGADSVAGVRPENQDRIAHFDSPFGYVFVLADGMGGYGGGGVASTLAVGHLPELLRATPVSHTPQNALTAAIRNLNRIITEEGAAAGGALEGMGTTLALVLVRETPDGLFAIGAHVGDSRIYFLRGGELFRLTRDHTVVEELIQSGAMTRTQADQHPHAGVLTRALGRRETLPVDLTSWTLLVPGDVFLLCSDGLSAFVHADAIRNGLLSGDPLDIAAHRLVDLALEKGSSDNVSVLLFRFTARPPAGHWPGRPATPERNPQ